MRIVTTHTPFTTPCVKSSKKNLLLSFHQVNLAVHMFPEGGFLMDLNSQLTTFIIAAVIFYAGVALIYFCAAPAVNRMEELDKQ